MRLHSACEFIKYRLQSKKSYLSKGNLLYKRTVQFRFCDAIYSINN
jgi:hypothetical protein